jgi:hypothetical protein
VVVQMMEVIINGLVQILGAEFLILIFSFLTFLIASINRGLGLISLLIMYMLTLYLILENQLLPGSTGIALGSFVVIGAFIGYLFYIMFLRD